MLSRLNLDSIQATTKRETAEKKQVSQEELSRDQTQQLYI